jgi:hypothetical protein
MTPYDLYRKFLNDLMFTPPEEGVEVKLARISTIVKRLEDIHAQGCMTDAATEAIDVLVIIRRYEAMVRML